MMKRAVLSVASIILLNTSFGAVINVPDDQPNIQAGIDAANTGDTVLVADGGYTGDGNRDIDFGGKAITVKSVNGPFYTHISCGAAPGNAHWAFYFHSGETRSSVVEGFYIMGAFADELGAVYISSSSPTIANCWIWGNQDCGIVVKGYESFPLILDCEVSDNIAHGVVVGDVLWPTASIEMTGTLISKNHWSGMWINSADNVIVTNCTFVDNAYEGIYIEGDPPKSSDGKDPVRVISNCISAFNGWFGIKQRQISPTYEFYCNDSYGNGYGDFVNIDAYWGDPNGNFSLDPVFCPPEWESDTYPIHSWSPCAPEHNDCGVLIGALGVGCSEILCSDVNGDGIAYTISDLVHLTRYMDGSALPAAPLGNSDVDLCGNVNASDLALYLEYIIFGLPSGICQPHAECYLPTGTNEVTLGCPVSIPAGEWDSVPLPIYATNDTEILAFFLGFHYDSDDIEVLSVDLTGSVLTNWEVIAGFPDDTAYVWPVPDSNRVSIVGYRDPLNGANLQPQEGGLLFSLWLRSSARLSEVAVDFDTVFMPPAGEFIFSPVGGGSIAPAYSDCGTEDIIIDAFICGDADDTGQVDIDDIIFMIDCIFVDCLGVPMERLDANCSGELDIDDVVYMVLFIFAGGNPPCDTDGDGVPDC